MIGCYVTGILPRPKELIKVTKVYDRERNNEKELEKAFEEATRKVIDAQTTAGLSCVSDGMLRWQDLLRPFTENLKGVKAGSLTRWFSNNTFYRKPVIIDDIQQEKSIVERIAYIKHLPKHIPWKAILPAPYTFAQLSENQFYKDRTELMFKYAKILRSEIESLVKLGFQYVQLSEPALVYNQPTASLPNDALENIGETLKIAVKGISIKTCLQTFFGDFSQILPEALDFPVDHLGIDLYETNLQKLREYTFQKGVALGLIDSRSSLIENKNELTTIANEIIKSIYPSKICEIFVCPNCDLEFLPWEDAEKKIRVTAAVAKRLERELDE